MLTTIRTIEEVSGAKIGSLNEQLTVKTKEVERLDAVMVAKDRKLSVAEKDLSEAKNQLYSLQQRCKSLETQLEKAERKNQILEVCTFIFYHTHSESLAHITLITRLKEGLTQT